MSEALFGGLGKIRVSNKGLYFKQGTYVVDLDDTKMITARSGLPAFIIEGTVVESSNPEIQAGSKPGQVIVIKPDLLKTVMGDLKQFAAAVMGIDNPNSYNEPPKPGETQDDANDRFWEETLTVLANEDENVVKGLRIKLTCMDIPMKTKAGTFTKHVWGPLVETE